MKLEVNKKKITAFFEYESWLSHVNYFHFQTSKIISYNKN